MASTIILSDNGASSGSAGLKQTAGNDGVLILQTTTSGGTATNAVYVDNNQRVGFGATPAGWNTTYSVLTINSAGNSLVGFTANDIGLCSGMYYNGGWKWAETNSLGGASYEQYNGNHYWAGVAPTSHTAGNAVSSLTTNLVLNATGALVLQSGNTSANGVGITFPATQSASTDVNTLDDYEEGSWTPVISGSASVSGQSYVAQKGLYVKVGKLVTVTLDVGLSAKGTMTGGNVVITGLPFVPNQYNAGGVANGSAFGYFGTLATSYIWVGWECDYGNSLMYLTGKTAAGISVSFLDPTNISDNTRFATSFSYITT